MLAVGIGQSVVDPRLHGPSISPHPYCFPLKSVPPSEISSQTASPTSPITNRTLFFVFTSCAIRKGLRKPYAYISEQTASLEEPTGTRPRFFAQGTPLPPLSTVYGLLFGALPPISTRSNLPNKFVKSDGWYFLAESPVTRYINPSLPNDIAPPSCNAAGVGGVSNKITSFFNSNCSVFGFIANRDRRFDGPVTGSSVHCPSNGV